MKSSTTIGVDSFACDCTFINTYGLLCVCELDRYSQISDLISLLSIYVHWKVLSISDIDNTNDSWGDLTLTNEGVALLKRLSLLDMDRKMTLHNKVWELTFLDTTSMRLAIKKIKTKGASKPVKYNKCEPLMWERVKLNKPSYSSKKMFCNGILIHWDLFWGWMLGFSGSLPMWSKGPFYLTYLRGEGSD